MYRPKSRTELYKEKLKERELYTNNILDNFTNNGGGASLKNEDGSIRTKRKTMLNSNYEDYFLNHINRNSTPISYNYNQQINSLQEMNSNINNNRLMDYNNNNNYYQTLPGGIIDNNVYNMRNINDIENNNTENINNNINEYQRRPRSQMNYNNNYIIYIIIRC